MKNLSKISIVLLITLNLMSCDDNDLPPIENEEEVIDLVTLTFTPDQGDAIVVTAIDPDGEGVEDLAPDSAINLNDSSTYTLTITLENTQAGENITEEVEEEGQEHMFFFSFSEGLFSNPLGDGNVDSRSDALNYNDVDANNLPVGLTTTWTTAGAASGTFRLILKHQPDIKSATSTSSDGESDLDIVWEMNVIAE